MCCTCCTGTCIGLLCPLVVLKRNGSPLGYFSQVQHTKEFQYADVNTRILKFLRPRLLRFSDLLLSNPFRNYFACHRSGVSVPLSLL